MARRTFSAWIALDMLNFDDARKLVVQTRDLVDGFKVHGLVEDALRDKVSALRECGAKKVWWDRKAHDTPTAVAMIARTALEVGVDRMTVHAAGGVAMMQAAVAHGPHEIVAITDLTSLTEAEIGMLSGKPADASVLLKARWARRANIKYLVCPGKEASLLNSRRAYSTSGQCNLELAGMKFIVTGSRTITDDMGSQKRSKTAMETLDAGADELVFGSEVWKSKDPRGALEEIYGLIAKHREVRKSSLGRT